MMTKMTGILARVLDDEVRLAIGPYEYQVLVPEAVRRQIQLRQGQEITFHISEYLEGNQSSSRFIPRKIGFLTETELEFFDLFCTVEKIGVKKALKAMSRPVQEIANAISREDGKWLTTLPGIGATTAEQIVTTLKRKVTKLAFTSAPAELGTLPAGEVAPIGPLPSTGDGQLIEDVYLALMGFGLSPIEARNRLDQLLKTGKPFADVQEAVTIIFSKG
jgi:Holliday junction DNA helicase RuvA